MKKWIIRLIYYCIRPVKIPFQTNRLLLIRYDAIGDYILFRNCIEPLKESKEFGKYKYTLLANAAIKDLVLGLDKEHFEDFIWTSQSVLQGNPAWDWNSLKLLIKLKLKGFDIVINPIHSRIANVDRFIGLIGAKKLIGSKGDMMNMRNDEKEKKRADLVYNVLVDVQDYATFEFIRNITFAYKLTSFSQKKIGLSITFPEGDNKFLHIKNAVILFPGAGAEYRRWPPEYFAELINMVRSFSTDFVFYIVGSKNDKYLSERTINSVEDKNAIIDLTGETTLFELLQLLKHCSLLISNETSAVHMGAALQIPVICISNGNHFGRFNPYPSEVSNTVITVYPDNTFYNRIYFKEHVEAFKFKSDLQISTIKPIDVFNQAKSILKSAE